jgi:hypothetical protein
MASWSSSNDLDTARLPTQVVPLMFKDNTFAGEGWQPAPDDAVSEDNLAALGDGGACSTEEEVADGDE